MIIYTNFFELTKIFYHLKLNKNFQLKLKKNYEWAKRKGKKNACILEIKF